MQGLDNDLLVSESAIPIVVKNQRAEISQVRRVEHLCDGFVFKSIQVPQLQPCQGFQVRQNFDDPTQVTELADVANVANRRLLQECEYLVPRRFEACLYSLDETAPKYPFIDLQPEFLRPFPAILLQQFVLALPQARDPRVR